MRTLHDSTILNICNRYKDNYNVWHKFSAVLAQSHPGAQEMLFWGYVSFFVDVSFDNVKATGLHRSVASVYYKFSDLPV